MVFKGSSAKISGFLGYIRSPEFVAVGSAIILTPIIAGFLVPLIRRIPVIGSRPIFVVIVAALIMFVLAKWIKGMYAKAILIGAAGGFLINAFVSSGIGQRLIGRLSSTVGTALS